MKEKSIYKDELCSSYTVVAAPAEVVVVVVVVVEVLLIDFKVARSEFDPIVVNTKELGSVEHAKILCVTISNTLQWNKKKVNKRLYFLVLLRRAKVSPSDTIRFYSTCIRPLLEYCSSVFRNAIPEYLSNDLEHVQKRVLSIISPGNSYNENLELFNMSSLYDKRTELCRKFLIMSLQIHQIRYIIYCLR